MVRENDRNKFKELAEKRVNKAIKDISLIGNLANKSNYDYTDADAKKILKALRDALEEVKARFDTGGNSGKPQFKLD